MERIRSVAFVVNVSKSGALELAEDLVQIATTAGTRTEILTAFPLESSALMGYDLCCVIGGDGTLLGVLDAVLASGSIVLGVNMGSSAFGDPNSVGGGRQLSSLDSGALRGQRA